MAPLDLPSLLRSTCGKHEVLLERYLQTLSHKEAQVDDEDDFYVVVLEGTFEDELVVIKIYGNPPGHNGYEGHKSADREVRALQRLSKSTSPCTHAPELRASFYASGYWCTGSRDAEDCSVVVMTKLPGKLIGAEVLSDLEQYRRVEAAFQEALDDIHSRGVDNLSYHDGNVLWHEQENKCYIIDYERTIYGGWDDSCFAEWMGAAPPPPASSAARDSKADEAACRAAAKEELRDQLVEEIEHAASMGIEELSLAPKPASKGVEESLNHTH